MDALIIILTGIVIASSCGLLGSFLVLRKMTMLGDAISHAVLPGIVIAYFIQQTRSNIPMLIGAAITGIITTFLIELIQKKTKLQSDASIGVTYTWLFAIGVILISLKASNVDIDQECVLYGDINYVALDPSYISFWLSLVNLAIVTLVIIIGYRGFKITSFNPDYAQSIGVKTGFWHYLLMSLVSLTAVLSFESVGAILVVGLFVVPPSTAYLMTHSLKKMIFITILIGVISSIMGYYLAYFLNSSVSGAIITISGVIFVITAIIVYLNKKRIKRNEYLS